MLSNQQLKLEQSEIQRLIQMEIEVGNFLRMEEDIVYTTQKLCRNEKYFTFGLIFISESNIIDLEAMSQRNSQVKWPECIEIYRLIKVK